MNIKQSSGEGLSQPQNQPLRRRARTGLLSIRSPQINFRGKQLFFHAALSGNLKKVRCFLGEISRQRMDPNVRLVLNYTILQLFAFGNFSKKHARVAQFLISQGADADLGNARELGHTPLALAFRFKNERYIQLLLKQRLDFQNEENQRIFLKAVDQGHRGIVVKALKSGVLNEWNSEQLNCLRIRVNRGANFEIAEIVTKKISSIRRQANDCVL